MQVRISEKQVPGVARDKMLDCKAKVKTYHKNDKHIRLFGKEHLPASSLGCQPSGKIFRCAWQ
jgi:hypothetical protein